MAVIGSQDQRGDTSFAGAEEEKKVEEEEEGGDEVYVPGSSAVEKPGSYPIELCSPLCSLLVSYAAHSVLRLSRLSPFCCGKGILDQHLKGIITGRTGAGLLNLHCITNS